MTYAGREPQDAEIEAILKAFDQISRHITRGGKINASGWREVHTCLASLSDFELWLGLCNLENALFDSGDHATVIQMTLYELFHIAYEHGLEALA